MTKRGFLLSIILSLVGVSMQAQSVAAEQMNECFNDSTKLPYGWFTEGWTMKDGAIQTAASSSQSTGGDDESGISSLLNSLMGGDSEPNYLLTPPLMVNEGETLVFSAKKEKSDDSGSGGFSFGSSDSTFVVERSVYSRNQWVRVADFTVDLDTIYKTFTIANTPAGEYRFRFKAGGTVLIDSVAGFHIDNEAPDLYIVENDTRAYHLDFSLCKEDSTRTLTVNASDTAYIDVTYLFDEQSLGMLNGTPVKGLYINNGKKIIR